MEIICEKYILLDCLYQTEVNTIYLTEHKSLHTKRIIKKMKKENNFQLPEVEILRQLSHPNIPKIIDVLEDETHIFLIRDYAPGKNLEEWMEEKDRFEEDELRKIGLQLADVLSYLHDSLDKPIIYRDLKPENIILDTKGYLYLIDFGIARQVRPDRRQDTHFLGTKAYAAPEQFGVFQSDQKSDIYAYGMTLYYLLSRHKITSPPYQRLDRDQWLGDYSQDLVALIYDCSQPQREKRPDSFREIKDLLSRGDQGEGQEEIPSSALVYLGLRRGAGTSFVLYAQAYKMAKGGKEVAILDWSDQQQITKLAYVLEEVESKKHSIRLDGMEIFPKNKGCHLPPNWQTYDRIFIDYGLISGEKIKQLAGLKDNIRLVSSAAIWDMVDFDEMMFNYRLIDYHFIINLGEEDRLQDLRQDYPDTIFEAFPYQKSIYDYGNQVPTKAKEISSNKWLEKAKQMKWFK